MNIIISALKKSSQRHLGQLRGELWRKSTRQWWTIQLSGKPYHEHHINDKQNQFKSISDDYDSDWGLNLTYIQNLIWLPEEELAFFFVLVPPEPIEIRGWLNAWIKIDLLTHITSAMSNVSTNQSVSYLVLTFKEYVKTLPEAQRTQGIDSLTWVISPVK